jgi:hypothetical protein
VLDGENSETPRGMPHAIDFGSMTFRALEAIEGRLRLACFQGVGMAPGHALERAAGLGCTDPLQVRDRAQAAQDLGRGDRLGDCGGLEVVAKERRGRRDAECPARAVGGDGVVSGQGILLRQPVDLVMQDRAQLVALRDIGAPCPALASCTAERNSRARRRAVPRRAFSAVR